MPIVTRGSSKGLMFIGLERVPEADEDDAAAAAEMLEAAFAFGHGWIEPLAVNVQVGFWDRDENFAGVPPEHDQVLVVRDIPQDLRVLAPKGVVLKHTNTLDESAIRSFVAEVLDKAPPAGCSTLVNEVSWEAMRVRFPSDEEIEMAYGDEPYLVRSELRSGERWVLGRTLQRLGQPLGLRLVNNHFSTHIDVTVHWRLWINDPRGRELLDQAVARVLARSGWTLKTIVEDT